MMPALIVALVIAQVLDSFSAGFIQFTRPNAFDESTRLDRQKWGEVLKSMKSAGFKTVKAAYVQPAADAARDITPGDVPF